MYEIDYLDIEEEKDYEILVQKVLEECFKQEKIENTKLIVNVILTNPVNIRNINREYRNVDMETDVLSFPMFIKDELEEKIEKNGFVHEDILGDIVVSIERVKEQAIEYGHSVEREFCYMLVHGFYHLMGYDHVDDEDKIEMRSLEEGVLTSLQITR